MKKRPLNWLVKERGDRRRVVQIVRFDRRERKFLGCGNHIESSLDALFGVVVRSKVPWTQT